MVGQTVQYQRIAPPNSSPLSAICLSIKLTTFLDVQKAASGKSRNFMYSFLYVCSVHLLYGYWTPKVGHHSKYLTARR